MSEPNLANIQAVKDYAAKLLSVLERIATAIEGNRIYAEPDSPPPQTHAAPTADAHASAVASAAPSAAPIDLVDAIPYDTVRRALHAYSDAKGEHATKAILKSFGANYIMDLKAHPEKYADVLKALK